MIDISNNDAFSIFRLSTAVNKLEHAPSLIQNLGIFAEVGIDTTQVGVEFQNDTLSLVSPTPRGGPGQSFDQAKRTAISLNIPHFEDKSGLLADEVQNVRAFGTDDQLEAVSAKVMAKLAASKRRLDTTLEHLRVGAMKGIVGYADGSSLNLYNVMGVTQPATVGMDLDATSPAEGKLRKDLVGIRRQISDALGGTGFTGISALVGRNYMDQLQRNPDVRETVKYWEAAQSLRESYGSEQPFSFGGVTFYEYRGEVGGASFIGDDDAHFFPVGVPDLFITYFGPGDLPSCVNTIGVRNYVNQYEMANRKGWHLDTQMNALSICTRPDTLIKATV